MNRGFTLIELLIVIAIIAIIAGAVLVAINPARRIAEANDSSRWAEVNSITSAISQYIVDNRGSDKICLSGNGGGRGDYCTEFVSTVSSGYCSPSTTDDTLNSYVACPSYTDSCQDIKNVNVGANAGAADEYYDSACDLSLLVSEGYFTSVPTDPAMNMATASTSRYRLWKKMNGSICVEAMDASEYAKEGGIIVCR